MRKLWTMAGVGVLSMLLGMPGLVWAQDEEKPPRQEEPRAEPKAEPKNAPREQEEKPPKQDEIKPPKHEDKQHPEGARQQEGPEHTAPAPAGKSAHIPDDKFRAHFGQGHTFVVERPVVVEGQPGFVYGGYSFVFAAPWPAGWAYTDPCYVDYIDGEYFLFDLLHPGVRIALFVVL
jgi:hypothetical protein